MEARGIPRVGLWAGHLFSSQTSEGKKSKAVFYRKFKRQLWLGLQSCEFQGVDLKLKQHQSLSLIYNIITVTSDFIIDSTRNLSSRHFSSTSQLTIEHCKHRLI